MDEQKKKQLDAAAEKDEINRLLASAKQGDQSVLPRLREFLDKHPEIWRRVGDLAEHAREALIALACGADLTAIESMRRKMERLQEELVGESKSPVVRLLAEQCVICWAQLHWAELTPIGKDQKSMPMGYEIQKRLNAIQGRYDRALKTLVTVQRLLASTEKDFKPNLKVVPRDSVA